MDEGYIKFKCRWLQAPPLSQKRIAAINAWRDKLFSRGLIGVYPDGVGYGNISMRFRGNTFIISGSATGAFRKLDDRHYVVVNDYNLAQNLLVCTGPIMASSESLSHAAVYESLPQIQAVIHVHCLTLWEKLLNMVPTTNSQAAFGTPEMAFEIKRLFRETTVEQEKILVMGGHREGIICFGDTLEEAGRVLLKYLE
ncbi:MAG: class II aldolase/adducin family protein [Bacteroidales bacterium]|nr:class II aldolase/adducin family protein [Bacteroidales bacterium]